MSESIVYSNVSVSSATGLVSVGQHTTSINFLNLDSSTNATVELNGGPVRVVIPAKDSGGGYVEIEGDYTKFQVITASVNLAVFAIG